MTIREHMEQTMHVLLDKMENAAKYMNERELKSLSEAVQALACWPTYNTLTDADWRKLAEHAVDQAIAAKVS